MLVAISTPFCLGGPAVARQHAPEQILERNVLRIERLAAAFEARQIQQVADDVLDAQRLVANDREIALARFGIERLRVQRQRFEIAAHAGQRRHQLVRHVGEQQAPRAIGGLQLRRALLQIVRHLIERARERRHLVSAVFTRARRQIARADCARGVLEASQPRTHRAENQQRGDGRADNDEHGADHRERRAELTQRGMRQRNHDARPGRRRR